MKDLVVVREWDADEFHAKVLELEKQGYVARRETYRITAEMNPETGFISHVHSIELAKANQPLINEDEHWFIRYLWVHLC